MLNSRGRSGHLCNLCIIVDFSKNDYNVSLLNKMLVLGLKITGGSKGTSYKSVAVD